MPDRGPIKALRQVPLRRVSSCQTWPPFRNRPLQGHSGAPPPPPGIGAMSCLHQCTWRQGHGWPSISDISGKTSERSIFLSLPFRFCNRPLAAICRTPAGCRGRNPVRAFGQQSHTAWRINFAGQVQPRQGDDTPEMGSLFEITCSRVEENRISRRQAWRQSTSTISTGSTSTPWR